MRTGASDRKRTSGSDDFGHLERDLEGAAVFNRAMVEVTRLVAHEVARAVDFPRVERIVDVGGGYGELLAAILAAHPRLNGVLFDLPHAINAAGASLAAAGVAARCELVAGSFFESVPAGADAYAAEERAAQLGRRALHADPAQLPAGGACRSRLLVVERVDGRPGLAGAARSGDRASGSEHAGGAERTGADGSGVPRAVRVRRLPDRPDRAGRRSSSA